jgi:hypothetical protein
MRAARLLPLVALLASAFLAGSAGAAQLSGPTGLHGFLLRADEPAPAGNVFSRTPAFAWDPVPGATGYEFQLSTSRPSGDGSVADNSIFFDTNSLTAPVVAPALTLPWITGRPHALYARVRATTPSGVTTWSADYGFDLEPNPAYPTPLATDGLPGLLRWTPIPGASAYEIWLVDLPSGGKHVLTRTNVLDEREFYTFHGSSAWVGSIRWRIRAIRSTENGGPGNGLPAVSYGDWSPIYRSTNPGLLNPALGSDMLAPAKTISDVVETGTNPQNEDPHKLMPAFTWTGSQVKLPNDSLVSSDLFRVEIFSDRRCLNLVYAGAIVGGRSWAPRPWGSLSLSSADSSQYASDGSQGVSTMFDGVPIESAEDLAPGGPTASAPPDAIPAGASQGVTAPPDAATFAPKPLTVTAPQPATTGAPVDLWDTYWPNTGYYWIVMPVAPALGSSSATVAAPGASKGSTLVPVSDSGTFADGQNITIGVAPNSDTVTIKSVGNQFLTVSAPLNFGHVPGDPIVTLGSSASAYRDVMLPEDMCGQAGMVHEFGLWSEPTVSSPQAPFITGLSSTGKLISAKSASQFYGKPLVAWAPALGAQKYEIEWSSDNSPFVAVGNILTTSTAALLPLTTGTWYYRVRGFDYNLPAGSQQMAWSDVQQLTISKPTFKVVQLGKAPTFKPVPRKKR